MVVESEVQTFWQWFLGDAWSLGAVGPGAVLTALAIAFLVLLLFIAAVRAGSLAAARVSAIFVELLAGVGLLIVAIWFVGAIFSGLASLDRSLGVSDAVSNAALAVSGWMAHLLGPTWHQSALVRGVSLVVSMLSVGYLLGWLFAALARGPIEAFRLLHATTFEMVVDVFCMSPMRVGALSWLTFKEAIRRRVVIVFGLFVVLLMFAGWFLDPGSDEPAKLYLSMLLSSTSFLVLIMALFLSALSLPADLKSKTIHTVVTKPVRKSEIVLGRMIGFGAIGSIFLLLMCVLSYVFVVRGLAHEHQISKADMEKIAKAVAQYQVDKKLPPPMRVRTTESHKHEHMLTIDLAAALKAAEAKSGAMQTAVTESEKQHTHTLRYALRLGDAKQPLLVQCSGPEGALQARSPIYGQLTFLDRRGHPIAKGINVGDEWTYRSYVEGATLAAAVWSFDDIRESEFPEGLPIEMDFEIYRTWKGEIARGVPGSISLRNPKTGLEVEAKVFATREFQTTRQFIPREIRNVTAPEGSLAAAKLAENGKIDLYKDLVDNGMLEVHLHCLGRQQYFGVAQTDLYIRQPDRAGAFEWNMLKGYAGIWMQMMLLTAFGVVFSTFLSGPIAILATGGVMVLGLAYSFLTEVAAHRAYGGGTFESTYRLLTQRISVNALDPTVQSSAMKLADRGMEGLLGLVAAIVPDFAKFDFSSYVATGYDINLSRVFLPAVVQTFALLLPMFILGYLFLKLREVAR